MAHIFTQVVPNYGINSEAIHIFDACFRLKKLIAAGLTGLNAILLGQDLLEVIKWCVSNGIESTCGGSVGETTEREASKVKPHDWADDQGLSTFTSTTTYTTPTTTTSTTTTSTFTAAPGCRFIFFLSLGSATLAIKVLFDDMASSRNKDFAHRASNPAARWLMMPHMLPKVSYEFGYETCNVIQENDDWLMSELLVETTLVMDITAN